MECTLMAKYATVFELVAQEQPDFPVHITRPHAISTAARWFLKHFPGKVVYAVKTNPEPHVLDLIHGAGVRHFDVASPREIQQIASRFPDAQMHYMHPV